MKDVTIKQYADLVKFAELKLKEDWVMAADPFKVIGVARDLGLDSLVQEFKDRLEQEQEIQDEIKAYHNPYLSTLGNH